MNSNMTKYIATFSDGTTIARNSHRVYTAAWRATWTAEGRSCSETGFSISPEAAKPYKPAPYYCGRGMSAADRAKATRKNEEYVAGIGYRVEIVPAVAV